MKSLVQDHWIVSDEAGVQTQLSSSKVYALGIKAHSQCGLLDTFPAPRDILGSMAETQKIAAPQNFKV